MNRGEIVVYLGDVPRMNAAKSSGSACIKDSADRLQAGARGRRSERRRIIGAGRNILERNVVRARIGQELHVVERG